jgi:hypothetical protein
VLRALPTRQEPGSWWVFELLSVGVLSQTFFGYLLNSKTQQKMVKSQKKSEGSARERGNHGLGGETVAERLELS